MITVVTGTDIEKLKGEFENLINGMNMVGKIPYDVYSELFDVGTDCIQKAYELNRSELEKENAELKEQNRNLLESCEGATIMYKDLCKAKACLEQLVSEITVGELEVDPNILQQAEQFLNSGVEK